MDKTQAKAFFAREFHDILRRAMAYGNDQPYAPGWRVAWFIDAEIRKVPHKMLARMGADDKAEEAANDTTALFVWPKVSRTTVALIYSPYPAVGTRL